MATQEQIYSTKILLNSENAKKEITSLEKKIESLKTKREEAFKAGDMKSWNKLGKEITKDQEKLDLMRGSLKKIDDTLSNMSAAGPKDLRDTIKAINQLLNDGSVQRGSQAWKDLTASLRSANTELRAVRTETAAQQSIWGRFTKFLNDSWGGLTMLIGSITGLSMTIRNVVKDFAKMEEEMANVRKYTGLSDEEVRALNEDLKKMDTRTSREELNQLAGAAGRLGITSIDAIEDFVEAGNMIKVALGDDLGDGAIDKVGKLAMAFGEDEKMGLRGAMEATGSAINELAQNSSAQAGYLVDFTARVAGFGKQLGLTQAQIMGFGAVMDENLLRDEMASTAFGNMLTKMQLDTAKFAKMAGMDIEEFSRLLTEDANAAILALADNLKKAGSQNMMKMLDDMGLDGARAVGVLATLADKVDDVRERQELATKAYKEAKSVGEEYNRMNETVEAQIEKGKKAFHEMSITLGQQLLPIVKYTISGGGLLVKGLSTLVSTFINFRTTIIATGTAIVLLTAYRKADVIWTKVQVLWNEKLIKGLKALRLAIMNNPWTAAIIAITAIGAAVWDFVKSSNEAAKKQREMNAALREQKAVADSLNRVKEEANRATAEELTHFNKLRKTLEDNTKKYTDRKKALDEIKRIVPSYHGSLTTENTLINSNASALDNYVTNLMNAARAQAAFNLQVKIQENTLKHEQRLSERQGNRLYAQKRLTEIGLPKGGELRSTESSNNSDDAYHIVDAQGRFVKYVSVEQAKQMKHYLQIIDYNDKRIEQENKVLAINKKQTDELQKIVDKGQDNKTDTTPTTPTYKTDNELQKEEKEREKAERERLDALREADRQEKALTDERLAENMLKYQAGLEDYQTYLAEQLKIQKEGLQARMNVWNEEDNEYKKLQKQLAALTLNGDREQTQLSMQELERQHQQRRAAIQSQLYDERSELYQNEVALNEALFQEDMNYLVRKHEKYREGSLEWMQTDWEIQDLDSKHKTEKEQQFLQRLAKLREEAGMKNYDELMNIELKGLEVIKDTLIAAGQMTEEEYNQIVANIKRKYEELKADQAADSSIKAKGTKALDTAKKAAGASDVDAGNDAATGIFSIKSAIENQKSINEQLKILYGKDYENNKEYQEAKRQLDAETMQGIVAGAQAAYQSISNMMSAASSLAQANSDLEVAKITANYDKQIQAAGKNSKKRERLEKERDEKIAKAKTKANQKAMAMEIAQAIAQTAMGAISAYSSTMAGAPYPANLVLAPISAGIALAAGAMQIATIKKQHQAEAMGYYEGGFTGGRRYRREAGVVHEGEFVVNHQAVGNPAVLPFLNFLDQAQRNNTVGSLTMQDVSRAAGGAAPTVLAPVVNVQNDNSELSGTLSEARDVLSRLTTQLELGIGVDIPIDGENGMYRRMKRYENLLKNK